MTQSELTQITTMLRDFTWGNTPEEMRSHFSAGFSLPPHPTAQVKAVAVGGVPAELVTLPESDPSRITLYLHGGGFVVGSCQTHRRVAADLAEASGAGVLTLDYRLAPEHPYPAALEDTLAAYRWLVGNREFRSEQVAIAGDSAGGNLVLASLVALREAGEALPTAAVLLSPYCDQMRTSPTITTHADRDPMVPRWLLDTVTGWYAPGQDLKQPLISPLYADLSGLPPLLIHVGASEILLDDALMLARQAGLSNVAVELKVWQNMIHCFHLFAPLLSEGRQAIAEIGSFLKRRWLAADAEG